MSEQPHIERRSRRGVETALLTHGRLTEVSVTVHVDEKAELALLLEAARDEIGSLGATILRQDVFGTSAQHGTACGLLREIFGNADWPVTWLEEGDSLGERLTGTHLYAVLGADVRRLEHDGETVGSVFSNGRADYCHLGGIVSGNTGKGRACQARDVLERIESVLQLAGMEFRDVVRTWFYLDSILDWYGDFNVIRTEFFNERGTFDGLVPASTGVGGGNRHGAAVVADALAIRQTGAGPKMQISEVGSPLQCAATAYRSSFSRAVEVADADARRLYVSGTASIDPDGNTICLGDVAGQVELTLDVVEAILESRGMDWEDVSRAIAYVKRGADVDAYHGCLARRGISTFPAVVTENDICRTELLFELEVDAWQVGTPAGDAAAGLLKG